MHAAGTVENSVPRTRLPRPENTNIAEISTEAEIVALPSVTVKWLMRPTSTMM